MFSIVFAILISGAVFKYWFAYEAKVLMEQASIEMQKVQKKRNNERLIQNKIAEQQLQKRKEQQKIARIKSAKQQRLRDAERDREIRENKAKFETCVFWQKQYQKYKGSYEKRMMDTACK